MAEQIYRSPEGDDGGGSLPKIKLGDVEYDTAEVEKWKASHEAAESRQADYTKKTTELARERERLAEQVKGVEILHDIVLKLESDPDMAESEFKHLTDAARSQKVKPSGDSREFRELKEKLADIEYERNKDRLRSDSKLGGVFAAFEGEIEDFAEKQRIGSLRIAAQSWVVENEEKVAEFRKKAEEASSREANRDNAKSRAEGSSRGAGGAYIVRDGESIQSAHARWEKESKT